MEVSGTANIQSAFRSELVEILYVLLTLQQICLLGGGVQGCTITIHCDGLSAIQILNKAPELSNYTKSNFDIINAVTNVRKQLPIVIKLAHIKRHQDHGTAYHRLTPLARLNVEADDLATTRAAQMNAHTQNLQNTSLPYSLCGVFIQSKLTGNTKINSNLTGSLQSIITKENL